MMTADQFRELKMFQKALEKDREKYETDYKKISRYVLPTRAYWEWEEETEDTRPKIYDATAVEANQKLADGYQGTMVNPRSVWFNLKLENPKLSKDRKMKAWLEEAQRGLLTIFARSNFYSAIGQCFADQALGTVVLYVEKDEETVINFIPQHLKGIYIAEDSHDRIDTVFHKMKLPNRVILKDYGDGLPDTEKERMKKAPFERSLVWRAVLPNDSYESGKMGPPGMKWASITYLDGNGDKPIKESGYKTMPYITWRPLKITGEAYGRSFAWMAIGDVIRINLLEKAILEKTHLSVKPPLNVPSELLDQVNVTPWGLNPYTDPSRIVFPMNIGGDIPYGIEEREQLRRQIQNYFHVDAFQLLSMNADKEYSATQSAEMAGEKSTMLTAHTARVGSELIDPMLQVSLVYGIEQGLIPKPPFKINPHEIKIDYVGPLTMDQDRAFKTSGIIRAMNLVLPFMEQKPEIWDLLKDDEIFRDLLEGGGMPDKHFYTQVEVAQTRQARAQQQAEVEQAELQKAQAQAYKDGTWKAEPGSLSKEVMNGGIPA